MKVGYRELRKHTQYKGRGGLFFQGAQWPTGRTHTHFGKLCLDQNWSQPTGSLFMVQQGIQTAMGEGKRAVQDYTSQILLER